MSLPPLPSLDQLTADPGKASALPPETARDLLLRLAPLQEALRLRALGALGSQNGGQPEAPAEADRLLPPEEAARLLGVEVSWLYRHRRRLPFARKLSHKTLRFSEAGLRKWQAQKRA